MDVISLTIGIFVGIGIGIVIGNRQVRKALMDMVEEFRQESEHRGQ